MARYKKVPDNLKVQSEEIEPTITLIVGKLWAQAEFMESTYGKCSWEYADALENLWHMVETLSSMSRLCIDTAHASVAMSNLTRKLAFMIEHRLGFSPLSESSRDYSFRTLMNCGSEGENDETR